MMNIENELVGKIIKDADGRVYHITSVLNKGGQGVVFRTAEDFLVKINTSSDRYKYAERYKWLQKKGTQLPEMTRVAFPLSVLEEPYIGYVMKEARGHAPLTGYIEKTEEISDLWDWYFNATGGLTKRLKIGYLLAKSLRYLHINGYAYVDLSPSNILVAREKNSLVMIDSDNVTSGVYKPLIDGTNLYMAPEIANKTAIASSVTDTYSYAILLFKMLTTCHPFIGDDAEEANPDWVLDSVDRGKLEYIGNPDSTENKNSNFESTKVFLTEELSNLFMRTFVDGKFESSKRPTLMEFMKACAHARNRVIQCDNPGCDAEFYYTGKGCSCPLCDKKPNKIYILSSKNMVKTQGKILIPLDESKEKKPLDIYADLVDVMAMTKEAKYINRSFLDEDIPFENDEHLAVITIDKNGKLNVMKLTDNKLILRHHNGTEVRSVPKYKKNAGGAMVIDEKPGIYFMLFDKNIDVTTETEYIDTSQIEKFYGKTEISKLIMIEQEINK